MDTPTGSGIYDKIIKELLEDIEQPLIEKVLGIKADKISKLNVITQLTDEREADFVIKVENRDEPFFIAHAEIQSTNDPKMLKRMLRYFVHLYSVHEVIIKQYVVFIGKDKMAMNNALDMPGVHYEYNLIDIRNIPCERFLYSGVPKEIVLSVLCNRGDRDERSFAREILKELVVNVIGGLDLSMYIKEVEVFSKLRDMQKIIIEEVDKMPIVYDLETDIRFMQGVQKGIENGRLEGLTEGQVKGRLEGRLEGLTEGQVKGRLEAMHSMIEVLLRRKFGARGLSLMPKIRMKDDESRLYAITDALITANDIMEIEDLL
ncbi:MAG: hypothetical protein SFH39_17250 [Candidatus Magnetobacterium sp. LHC-1]|uniref:DUF4351 domain-containing protein n=1 Tax=Candidatus Magnetobacterium casense TaxID=1455061 RepID=A0ABS6RYP3_9BACT|nr:hypothetical protein [Candidatus Magnetobacterium casensis]MBF0608224.1 hypothetical protein [Nitrospirota bacterium]MBV6341154.1 hypothetical protein [Candidatus Magnetobacterium casensis]